MKYVVEDTCKTDGLTHLTIRPTYDLVDQTIALYVRSLQFKLSCCYWNL